MHNESASNNTLVELHVEDFEPIRSYYTALGFTVAWEHPASGFDGYLVMQMEGNILCFWAGNQEVYNQPHFKQFPKDTPRGYGVEVVICIADVQQYYERVKNAANVVEPITKQPWGLYDFRAVDPAGYYLRFTSLHNILHANNTVTDV